MADDLAEQVMNIYGVHDLDAESVVAVPDDGKIGLINWLVSYLRGKRDSLNDTVNRAAAVNELKADIANTKYKAHADTLKKVIARLEVPT